MQNDTIDELEPGLGEVESGEPAAAVRRGGFGLRGRLTFAFVAVAAAGLVSCGVALVQFGSIRAELDAVTQRSLPAITAAQNVAAESARLAAAAMSGLTVGTGANSGNCMPRPLPASAMISGMLRAGWSGVGPFMAIMTPSASCGAPPGRNEASRYSSSRPSSGARPI